MLVRCIEGVRLPIPYDQASAQRDAYYSGWDEADTIWRALQDAKTDKIVSVTIINDGRTTPTVTAITRSGVVIDGPRDAEG